MTPYIKVLKNILSGIKKSRAFFESKPDTGFFGKNFSRLFNYFECYIFRLIIVFLIIVGIGMPALIIVNSTISFLLAISSWLWTPLTLIFRILFNVLIFDTDSPLKN